MAAVTRREVATIVEQLILDIIATVRPLQPPNAIRLDEVLIEIGKSLLDPAIREHSFPVTEMWRFLMGLQIAGALTEDDLIIFSGTFRDCSLMLYPVNDD